MTVDVWMQHPTPGLLSEEHFASLQRWTGGAIPEGAPPIASTLLAMDEGGVDVGVLSAWYGPQGALISNDEVAGWVAEHPDRLAGLAGVNIRRPVEAVRELRRCVEELGLKGLRIIPWLWERAADGPALLPALHGVRGARRPGLHAGRAHGPAALVRARPADPVHRRHRDRLPRADDRLRPHRLPVDRGDGGGGAQAPERRDRHVRLHRAPVSAGARPVPEGRRRGQGAVRLQLADDRRPRARSSTSTRSSSTTRRARRSSTATRGASSGCERAAHPRHRRPHRPRQDGAGARRSPASTPTGCRRRRRAASRSRSATRRSTCRRGGGCRWSTSPATSASCARWWRARAGSTCS